MKKARGMSLVEMLVSMVILAIILLGVTRYIQNQLRQVRQQEMLADVQQNVRTAMDVMVRDIRWAEFDPVNPQTSSPFKRFLIATRESCVFYTDANANGQMEASDARGFKKYTTGDSLAVLTVVSPMQWQTMAVNTDDLRYTYFNAFGRAIAFDGQGRLNGTQLDSIFAVRVYLSGRTPRPWSLQPLIRPRRELLVMVQLRNRMGY
jgi:prepilin-type N-terminal cleavage/methylation domain-containing protein